MRRDGARPAQGKRSTKAVDEPSVILEVETAYRQIVSAAAAQANPMITKRGGRAANIRQIRLAAQRRPMAPVVGTLDAQNKTTTVAPTHPGRQRLDPLVLQRPELQRTGCRSAFCHRSRYVFLRQRSNAAADHNPVETRLYRRLPVAAAPIATRQRIKPGIRIGRIVNDQFRLFPVEQQTRRPHSDNEYLFLIRSLFNIFTSGCLAS